MTRCLSGAVMSHYQVQLITWQSSYEFLRLTRIQCYIPCKGCVHVQPVKCMWFTGPYLYNQLEPVEQNDLLVETLIVMQKYQCGNASVVYLL